MQGFSAALSLHLRWENGQLAWYDPETEEHIATFQSEREGRLQAEARARYAETRARELEAEIRRLRGN